MKTHRRKFMPQFHDAVRRGIKRQTVRPWPRVHIEPGDTFIAEAWAGKPYRSKVIQLTTGTISHPLEEACFYVGTLGTAITVGNRGLTAEEAEAFAKADGFHGLAALFQWFDKTHGLPFVGALIKWSPRNPSATA